MLKDCIALTDITEEVFYIDTSNLNYFKITEEEFIRAGTGGVKQKSRGMYFQFNGVQEKVCVVVTEEEYRGVMHQIDNILKGPGL